MVVVKKNKKTKRFSSSKNKKRQMSLSKKEGAMLLTAFFILILVFINFFESKGTLQAAPFITKTGITLDLKEGDKLKPEVIISESQVVKRGNSNQISGVETNKQREEFKDNLEEFENGVAGFEYITEEIDDELEREEIIEIDEMGMEGDESNQIPDIEEENGRTWLSFGDTFSGNAYLDMGRTNMYIDYQSTALSFPPKYNFSFSVCNSSCIKTHAFEEVSATVYTEYADSNKPQGLPQELKDKEISFKALYQLNKKEVAVFIVLEDKQDKLYAYFYDSGKYETILNDDSGLKTSTRYSRLGGKLDVAGSDDDFVILYAGYEIKAFHYSQKKIKDISHFLGLRVASGGFIPKIIKQGQGNDSLWYVFGVADNRARLIKLWQNSSPNITGSLDLSFALEHKLREEGVSVKAVSSGHTYGQLAFLLNNSEQDTALSFSDYGFDNSLPRQVVSQNINKKGLNVFKAVINKAILSGVPDASLTNVCKLYLGDDLASLQAVEIGQELSFSGENSALYWQIKCSSRGNNYFSPWIGHVNDIRYQLGSR